MKAALLDLIRSELRQRLDRLTKAAQAAHAAATDQDSKAESKYDTRNLEAGYLASGQAQKVRELAGELVVFEALRLPDFAEDEAIDAGALVELEMSGESMRFLLVPAAGGMEVEWEESEITLLSPASPLYRKLVGLRAGEALAAPRMKVSRVS